MRHQPCAITNNYQRESSMEKQMILTKRLAIIGCVFLWLPLVAPVIFALRSVSRQAATSCWIF